MNMSQRVSLITLAARDIEALATFYDALGWQRVETPDGVIAYDLLGQTLGLYPRDKLAEDLRLDAKDLGSGASTLSHNVSSQEEVTALLDVAESAGAKILRPAGDVFWGGFIGYFADPEGHIWEVAHNPFSPLGPNGEFRWNGYG